MEARNLASASEYVNNLLLARGLLRDGKSIDFANEAGDSGDHEETIARTINLVHDLVVRRDREEEQRERLVGTIRNLRTVESKQTLEIENLEIKTGDLARSVALAEGQERVFKNTIRDADTTIRGLKEQVQRMKSSIQQIRAQCATDVRKRDVEMQKLKTHLGERQRSKKEAVGITTISISPPHKFSCAGRKTTEGGANIGVPGYSLKQETTEFLTQLCQSLSDENDALIHLSERTIQTLKELQGLTELPNKASDDMSQLSQSVNPATADCPNHEQLAMNTDIVLDQLRTLLTNPSFVPLEEVEVRDNEISRLRDGWEKMESRWQDAVAMMDGWHRRLSDGSAPVNIREMKLSMPFQADVQGKSKGSMGNNVKPVLIHNGNDLGNTTENELSSCDKTADLRIEKSEKSLSRNDAPLRECSGNEHVARRDNSLALPKESGRNIEMAPVKKARPGNTQQKQRKVQLNANPRGQATQKTISRSASTNLTTLEEEAEITERERERQRNQTKKRSSSSRVLGRKTRQKTGDPHQNTASTR